MSKSWLRKKRFFLMSGVCVLLALQAPLQISADDTRKPGHAPIECEKIIENLLYGILGISKLENGQRVFRFGKQLSLTEIELEEWRKVFGEEAMQVPTTLSNFPEEYFFSYYDQLPGHIQAKLEDLTGTQSEVKKTLYDLTRRIKLPYGTFLDDLARSERIPQLGSQSFGENLKKGRETFRNLPDERAGEVRRDISYRQRVMKAKLKWNSYAVLVPIERTGKNKVVVTIGEHTYAGFIKGNQIILTVPASKIKVPVWNPLDHKKLIRMRQNLHNLPMPRAFGVNMGLNGYFYPWNGNHRFTAISRTKAEVRVALPYPLETATLRSFLDAIGIRQPENSTLIEIMDGKKDPFDTIPAQIRRTLLWQSSDLKR